jgi:hypothetical protein
MFQYIPVCTILQILVLLCTSMYLYILFLVPSCTTLYHLVPPCTMTVQESTYLNIPVHTDLGIFYVSTYWYVPFGGFSYRHVVRSVRTEMLQNILPCTAIYQVYRIPDGRQLHPTQSRARFSRANSESESCYTLLRPVPAAAARHQQTSGIVTSGIYLVHSSMDRYVPWYSMVPK